MNPWSILNTLPREATGHADTFAQFVTAFIAHREMLLRVVLFTDVARLVIERAPEDGGLYDMEFARMTESEINAARLLAQELVVSVQEVD